MSSMQNIISWIRSKSKKTKSRSPTLYPGACEIDLDIGDVRPRSRSSVCRSSMKLPPIPRGEVTRQSSGHPTNRRLCVPMMGVASLRTDSPAHIYEEILINDTDSLQGHSDDSENSNNSRDGTEDGLTEKVNVDNLDFHHAKDFGSFLVVPIRSKVPGQTTTTTEREENNNTEPNLELNANSHCDRKPSFITHGGESCLDNVSCTYPGDVGSSGDSAIADMSTSHDHSSDSFPHLHCARCRRPHGIFNGITLSHIDEKIDLEGLEIQTYFNKQMLQHPEEEEKVERFLIVPSVIGTGDVQQTEISQEGGPSEDNVNKMKDMVQGSDDSNDTCNEYDIRSSDMSSSSHSRPGSYAFDSGSSLYAFSNSSDSKDPSLPLKTSMAQLVRHRPQESDSSNDTFSEYDAHPSGGEYEYYLSKAEHNLWLKKDVMRVIRESESSEYETTDSQSCRCDCPASRNGSDNSSLTTITSLSDLSLSDKEDDSPRPHKREKCRSENSKQCSCQGERHRKSSKQKTKVRTKHKQHGSESRTQKKHCTTKEQVTGASAVPAPAVPAWEREDRGQSAFTEYKKPSHRKPRMSSHKKRAELYCLPDFSDSSLSPRDSDVLEKLSCRATDFTPKIPQVSRSNSNRKLTPEPPVVNRRLPQQNRILSDLMKMNHDRLLVQF